jgi:hypothetical protein
MKGRGGRACGGAICCSGGAAGAGGLLLGGRAWAARSWGEAPAGHADLVLPRGERAERCLEVFLYGGLGPFESFYVVPEYGRPQDPDFPDQQWWLFANDHEQTFTGCGLPDRASWLEPFGADALGRTVQLGPVVQAFRDRPDLLARMRIVVMGHELEPHEAAIPYSLSGYRLGNPRMAGTAAHLQRYFQERDGARSTPYAYTFTPLTELSTDNLRAANAVGMHPGSTRPLGLKIGLSNTFSAQLERARVGDRRAAVDELRAHLLARAEDRYTDPAGAALRSRALADHAYAVGALADADALSQVLTPDLFTVADSSWCGSRPSFDLTTTSLHAAVSLLTHPTEPARYALVVDGGLIPAAGGGALDTPRGPPRDPRPQPRAHAPRPRGAHQRPRRERPRQGVARRHPRGHHHRLRADPVPAGRLAQRHQPPPVRLRPGAPRRPRAERGLRGHRPGRRRRGPLHARRAAGGDAGGDGVVAVRRRVVRGRRRSGRRLRGRGPGARHVHGPRGGAVIALVLAGCGGDPAPRPSPDPGPPSGTFETTTPPEPPPPPEVPGSCDAGDAAWVTRALTLVLGRRPHSSAEVRTWVAVVESQGRQVAVRAMSRTADAHAAWGDWLEDELYVARTGDKLHYSCWGAPRLPPQGGALAAFLRSEPPTAVYPGGAFSMADVLRDALWADDLSVVHPRTVRAHEPAHGGGQRQRRGARVQRAGQLRRGVPRHVPRPQPHLPVVPQQRVLGHPDRTFPTPGLVDQAVFGSSTGRPSPEEIDAMFAVDGVTSGRRGLSFPGVEPWGMVGQCASFVDPATRPVEPDWIGQDTRYLVLPYGPEGDVWEVSAHLRAGMDAVEGVGLEVAADGAVDGEAALAMLTAERLAGRAWATAVGAPLTIAHGFPRNEAQRDVLARLARALVDRWSLADLLVAITSEEAFSPGVGCGAPPYGLPPLYDPWVTSDEDPERHGNGPGDRVHALPARTALRSAHHALGWPAPSEWVAGQPAEAVQAAIGVFLRESQPGFTGSDFQGFLEFEAAYGGCTYPGGASPATDLLDRLVADGAAGGATARDLVAALRDRLLLDGATDRAEDALLERLSGRRWTPRRRTWWTCARASARTAARSCCRRTGGSWRRARWARRRRPGRPRRTARAWWRRSARWAWWRPVRVVS